MTEIWKSVVGAEGRYEVSNFGRVRSIDHYVRLFTRWGKEMRRRVVGRVLKPGKGVRNGHPTVAIGKGRSIHVHCLVAKAFIGPKPLKMEVLHLNHNPEDNRVENLKYGTRSENLKMDYAIGKRKRK